jgi:enoyl-CoA hydratase/carnithine racemase
MTGTTDTATPDPTASVRTTLDGGVLRVTLDRPGKKNALTQTMYGALADALERAEADSDVRVVLLAGAGGDFCAGNDLADFDLGAADGGGGESGTARFLRSLALATVPLVVAVQGVAIGVGTTLLLHADVVHAAADARFRLPFVDLGLVPEAASTLLLPQLIGHRRAADLLYTSRFFGADEAHALGIVSTVVEPDRLTASTEEVAHLLASKAPGALRKTKELLRTPSAALTERMALEARAFAAQLATPEFTEASAAFFEKRAPRF